MQPTVCEYFFDKAVYMGEAEVMEQYWKFIVPLVYSCYNLIMKYQKYIDNVRQMDTSHNYNDDSFLRMEEKLASISLKGMLYYIERGLTAGNVEEYKEYEREKAKEYLGGQGNVTPFDDFSIKIEESKLQEFPFKKRNKKRRRNSEEHKYKWGWLEMIEGKERSISQRRPY